VIADSDIGGVHIKYLHHCRRQLWLFGRGFRPEQRSELVQSGEALHETSFRRHSPVDLGAAQLDFVDGEHWVHEVKSAARPSPADEAQVMHYCFRLREAGVDAAGGVLHYPKSRQTRRIGYGEPERAKAVEDIAEALAVLNSAQSPPKLPKRACYGCSYLDYCWSS
jgi:CRISPR-associated exonuclease Cas4